MNSLKSKLALWALMAIPLQSPEGWQVLEYSKLKANTVSFTKSGMNIAVDSSASPIIYPFKQKKTIKKLTVQGRIDQLIPFKKGEIQGAKKLDDYTLRLGLVIAGDKKLNFAQKLIAPSWVKKLYSLAPKGTGIDHIYFINGTQQKNLVGTKRVHPLTKLIKENNPWLLDKTGEFQFEYKLPQSLEVLALWISIDGDDTKSSYNVNLKNLVVE